MIFLRGGASPLLIFFVFQSSSLSFINFPLKGACIKIYVNRREPSQQSSMGLQEVAAYTAMIKEEANGATRSARCKEG
jgi:hypothetical protein